MPQGLAMSLAEEAEVAARVKESRSLKKNEMCKGGAGQGFEEDGWDEEDEVGSLARALGLTAPGRRIRGDIINNPDNPCDFSQHDSLEEHGGDTAGEDFDRFDVKKKRGKDRDNPTATAEEAEAETKSTAAEAPTGDPE